MKSYHPLGVKSYFFGRLGLVVGWAGGWLEIWGLKLNSSQVVDEVEIKVELGNCL